jgi:gliding motility-associated-like protein
VYSRWGELVFEAADPQKAWDGNINGRPASSDVYGWSLQYKKGGNEFITEKGDVTLLR